MKRTITSITILFILFCPSAVAETKEAKATGTVYHGNSKSHVYHSPGCRYYNCKACTVILKSEKEAKVKIFKKCRQE
jgi:ferredoxin